MKYILTLIILATTTYSTMVMANENLETEVPIASNNIERNQIITANDLEYLGINSDDLKYGIITNDSEIIGKSAKRNILKGKTFRFSDLTQPLMVERNNKVTIKYNSNNISLKTLGIALENGQNGSTIKVKNIDSKRIIEATVTSNDTVTVF